MEAKSSINDSSTLDDRLSVSDKSPTNELGSISDKSPNELESVSEPSSNDRKSVQEFSTYAPFSSSTSKPRQLRISTEAIEEVDPEGSIVFHHIPFSDLIRIVADINNPHQLSFQYRRDTFLHTLSYHIEQVILQVY